jgi:hypothetical protein
MGAWLRQPARTGQLGCGTLQRTSASVNASVTLIALALSHSLRMHALMVRDSLCALGLDKLDQASKRCKAGLSGHAFSSKRREITSQGDLSSILIHTCGKL